MASYIVRVFKAFGAPNNRPWVNTYELSDGTLGAGDLSSAELKAQDIMLAEREIHYDEVYFTRYTVSTWEPDSTPYNPETLITRSTNLRGLVQTGAGGAGDLVDLRMVLRMDRIATTGKPGRLFYRGCMKEADVETVAGRVRLAPNSGPAARQMVFLDKMDNAIGPFGAGYVLALIGGTLVKTLVAGLEGGLTVTKVRRTYAAPYTFRPITNLVIAGVSITSDNHSYYDRPV